MISVGFFLPIHLPRIGSPKFFGYFIWWQFQKEDGSIRTCLQGRVELLFEIHKLKIFALFCAGWEYLCSCEIQRSTIQRSFFYYLEPRGANQMENKK